jgi:hypothetical protein
MSFLTPFWLIALVPWLGLVLWMLIGQRRSADVPFLQLWRGREPLPKAKRALRAPPAALVLVLLAIGISILAAAGPAVRDPTRGQPITMIVDRGVSTSGAYEELLQFGVRAGLVLGFGPVDLVLIPDGSIINTDRSDWIARARKVGSSSLDTTSMLRSAVSDALKRNDWPIMVLSNANIELDDPRVVRITLSSVVQNVGIVRVAAREHPTPQVMVTIRNQSSFRNAPLTVASAGQTRTKTISLPEKPAEQAHFIDLPALGSLVQVSVSVPGDELLADNAAWLVRQRAWPHIETRILLSPELERIVQVYAKHRPAGKGATRVAITDRADLSEPAVVVASRPDHAVAADVQLSVAPHPITQHVDWKPLPDMKLAPAPGAGWQPVVSAGDRPLVAVREAPARQVWVGFSSESFARTPDFVAFWTNVFDWPGQADEQFAGERVQMLGSEWRRRDDLSGGAPLPIAPAPGVYGREDGALRAISVLDVLLAPAPVAEHDWRTRLEQLKSSTAGLQQLRRPALFAALGAVLLASLVWGRSRAAAKAVPA